MAQAEVNKRRMSSSESTVDNETTCNNKRKVGFNLDGCHHLSVFKNETANGVLNIRRGTRSVTISREVLLQICDLREILLQCLDFIED